MMTVICPTQSTGLLQWSKWQVCDVTNDETLEVCTGAGSTP